MLSYLVDSGRILVASELFGHYGRLRQTKRGLLATQERRLKRAKDLMRVVDYLATRTNVDMSRIGYLGASSGAQTGPLNLVVDERYRLGVLLDGGLPRYECLPSCDPYDFAPQVRVPVMMVNGRNDVIYPYLESQRPLFELLNMPEDTSEHADVEMPVDREANEIRKRHVVNDGGHGLYAYANRQSQGDIVNWLDKWLGIPARQTK